MVSKELIEFMRGSFGNECLRILNEIHQKIGVEDIEDASIEDRKNFIIELQPLLRNKNITRSEIMVTELMNLLNVNIYESGKNNLGISKNDRILIESYINRFGERKIKSSLESMNSIIRLYMSKTKFALKQGVSEKTIEKNTDKVLEGIRKNLISMGKDIEQNFNINTSVPFIEKKIKDMEENGDVLNIDRIKRQIELAESIRNYGAEMNSIFEKYKSNFMNNLKTKIYLEKQKLPSDYIIKKTETLSNQFFQNILEIYDKLKHKVKL